MSRAKVVAAKQLIEEKHFDEARAILKTINHPAAGDWIAKIDALAPAQTIVLTDEPPADQPTIKATIIGRAESRSFSKTAYEPRASGVENGTKTQKPLQVIKSLALRTKRVIGWAAGQGSRQIASHLFQLARVAVGLSSASSGDQIGYYARPTEKARAFQTTIPRRKTIRLTFIVSCVCALAWLFLVVLIWFPPGTPGKTIGDAAPAVAMKIDTSQRRLTPTPSLSPEGVFQVNILDSLSNPLQIQSVRVTGTKQGIYTVTVTYTTVASTSQELVDEWMAILRPLAQVIADQGLGTGDVVLLLVDHNGEKTGQFSALGQDLLAFEAQKITRAEFLTRARYEPYKSTAPSQPTSTKAPVAR